MRRFEKGLANACRRMSYDGVPTNVPENEEELAARVKLLSKSALEVFVKDEKFEAARMREQAGQDKNENGSQEPLFEDKSLSGQTLNFELSEDVTKEFNALHAQGHDVNALSRTHDPQFLAPLCAEHHAVAHSVDVRFWERRGD